MNIKKELAKIEKQEKAHKKLQERLKVARLKEFNRKRIAAVKKEIAKRSTRARAGKVISKFKLSPTSQKNLATNSRKFGKGLVKFINSIEVSEELQPKRRKKRRKK